MKLAQNNKQSIANDNGLFILICGTLVLLLSSAALLGWIFDLPVLTRGKSNWVPTVFNTAVCCFLGGFAILLTFLLPVQQASKGLRLIAAIILLISSLSLLEVISGLDLKLDLADMHRSLQAEHIYPGRMPPLTSAALLSFGLGLLVYSFKTNRIQHRKQIIQIFATIAGLLGWMGFFDYWINMEYLYNWTGNVRMAIPASISIILLGFGLFNMSKLENDEEENNPLSSNVRKVYITAALALTIICTLTGVSTFAIFAQRTNDIISGHLKQMANDRLFFFQKSLRSRTEYAHLLSTSPQLSAVVSELNKMPKNLRLKNRLISLSHNLRSDEVTAIAYEGISGELWPGSGQLSNYDAFEVMFHGDHKGVLLWDSGYKLRSRIAMHLNGVLVGYIWIEQRLQSINALRESTIIQNSSRDMVVCSAEGTVLNCFPSSIVEKPFRIQKFYQKHRIPMSRALDLKETGLINTIDYKGDRVLAAYGPIGNTGLGMVIKMDIAEIYSPIKEQFHRAAWFIFGLLGLGLWFIHRNLVPLIRNIDSARRQAEREKIRFVAATEGSFDSFYIFDSVRDENHQIIDFRCSYINQRGGDLISRKPEEFINTLLLQELPFTRGPMYFDRFKQVIDTGISINDELKLDKASIAASWIARQIVKLGDGVAVTLRDISEQKKNESHMHHVAMHDVLTNLPNRALFDDRINTAMKQAKRDNTQMAIALIDIDYFKKVNDTFGHHVGDALLKEFAARISVNIRPSDTLARLGGDEFALILPNTDHPKESSIVLMKLFKVLQSPIQATGYKLQVGISVGIAAYPKDGTDLNVLIRHADEAMYNAKAAGRNNFQIYEAKNR
ncbi:MAG: hypothetical protein CTY33_00455 [Methylotenera sp.]|nr:MAG: hypothetical protein CTY33_00455 [Methylotenera sp.]